MSSTFLSCFTISHPNGVSSCCSRLDRAFTSSVLGGGIYGFWESRCLSSHSQCGVPPRPNPSLCLRRPAALGARAHDWGCDFTNTFSEHPMWACRAGHVSYLVHFPCFRIPTCLFIGHGVTPWGHGECPFLQLIQAPFVARMHCST